MRRLLIVPSCSLAAAPAHAAPRALLEGPRSAALAGDTLLYARTQDEHLRVFAQPLAGGPPAQVFAFDAAPGAQPAAGLAASPQKAAIALSVDDDTGDFASTQAFAGPPAGPCAPLDAARAPRDDGRDRPAPQPGRRRAVFTHRVARSVAQPGGRRRATPSRTTSRAPGRRGARPRSSPATSSPTSTRARRRRRAASWRTGAPRAAARSSCPTPTELRRAAPRRPRGRDGHQRRATLYDGRRTASDRRRAGDRRVRRRSHRVPPSATALRVLEPRRPHPRVRRPDRVPRRLRRPTARRVLWWTPTAACWSPT